MYKICISIAFLYSQFLISQEDINNTPIVSEINNDEIQKDFFVPKIEKSQTLLVLNSEAEPSIKREYKKSENIRENFRLRLTPVQRTKLSEAELKKQADILHDKQKYPAKKENN